jgi:uncharacterized protein (DUF697 family)
MDRAQRLTHGFSAGVAAVGFFVEPIPLLDEMLMIPMQYALVASLARAHGQALSSAPWGKASLIIWGGVGLRSISELLFTFVPVVGPASNAALALATTEVLGHYVDRALRPAQAS